MIASYNLQSHEHESHVLPNPKDELVDLVMVIGAAFE